MVVFPQQHTKGESLVMSRGHILTSNPPVDDMNTRWHGEEKIAVDRFLGAAVIGGPQTVRAKLGALLAETDADELMLVSDFYEHTHRLRSFDIAAGLQRD